MSNDSVNPLERMLDSAARRLAGGNVHPLEILQRVQSAFEAGVSDGTAPNRIVISFSPDDYDGYRNSLPQLREEVLSLLLELEARRGYTRIGDIAVQLESSDFVPTGRPRIEAQFAARHIEQTAVPGATRRIVRHRNLAFVVDGAEFVAVTHTPFSIGRGPGNDLVLPSMSVSRNHAELLRTENGFLLRDLGSKNGLVVNAKRFEEVVLTPGLPVLVGDITLSLERTA
ncbi:hypothetical protein AYO38_00905 [bacterium SCGC AG-212-C10]|nr:hypothetical protein AYO38_00905 [bacterium SCGC AG-212-C10]